MADTKAASAQPNASKQAADTKQTEQSTERTIPKPESTSEYEGAASRKPSGNQGSEVKTETSSSSGE